MKEIDECCEYILSDVLGHVEGVTAKKMFSGYGLYYHGTIFGIITGVDELRFKVDDTTRSKYEEMGSTPFIFTGYKNRPPLTMHYYLVPEEVQENREEITTWLLDAVAVSKRSERKK